METLPIGDLAARSGVAPSALRYYEREGLIRSTRTGGNQRRYHRSELRRVAFIKIAQQVGVSLDEIRGALSELPEGRTPTKADWARLSAAGAASWRNASCSCSGCATSSPGASAAAACPCNAAT